VPFGTINSAVSVPFVDLMGFESGRIMSLRTLCITSDLSARNGEVSKVRMLTFGVQMSREDAYKGTQ
jgi:hypothetical protein